MVNKIILIGNMTKDIEVRTTPNGKTVGGFGIALNETYNGEKKATFLNCVAWEKTAENLSKYCGKGSLIYVEGKIQNRSWDKPDGTKGYATEIVCLNVKFLNSKKKEQPAQADEKYGKLEADQEFVL